MDYLVNGGVFEWIGAKRPHVAPKSPNSGAHSSDYFMNRQVWGIGKENHVIEGFRSANLGIALFDNSVYYGNKRTSRIGISEILEELVQSYFIIN